MTHEITLKCKLNGAEKVLTAKAGQTLEQIVANAYDLPQSEPPIMGAVINNLLKDLRYPLFCDAEIEWQDALSPLGTRIMQNSLAMLLSAAAEEIFPNYRLHIFHSLRTGRFCKLLPKDGEPPLTHADIKRLAEKMQELVQANLPIEKNQISLTDAISFCRSVGDEPKAETLTQMGDKQVALYTLNGCTHHMFSKLVPKTGCLGNFCLTPFEDGFALQSGYKQSKCDADKSTNGADNTQKFAYPKTLNATLENYDKWINMQDINFACDLNRYIEKDDFNSLVIMAEARQSRDLQSIADDINKAFPRVRLVLIAGPSSSGKTSFCNRLALELRAYGLKPITLSMDNYFKNNADLTPGPDGQLDFESLSAVDTELFNKHLLQMLAGEEVAMPVFDFKSGCRSDRTIPVQLGDRHILLIEGIHGINEALTCDIPAENKLKIYISCMTALNLDDLTPISTSDNREIRRLVRDVKFRNISAEKTLLTWQKVRSGEERNIFPFQDSADYYFNTSLIYEFSLLAPLITPHLQAIPQNSPAYPEARRLLKLVSCFIPGDQKAVPAYSLLQEFLGGSVFEI
jgi:uridine kinase